MAMDVRLRSLRNLAAAVRLRRGRVQVVIVARTSSGGTVGADAPLLDVRALSSER
jgi:hypothetical protein